MSQIIVEKTITILSPRPGAYWLMEGKSRHVVKWKSTGVKGILIFLELYNEESDEEPMTRWLVSKGVDAVSQNYSVVLADIQSEHTIVADTFYKIRIVDAEGEISDVVSEFFAIVKEL